MKNKCLKRIICLVLALVLALPLAACGKKEAPFMELERKSMSLGVYNLMLSVQKGNMAYFINHYYGAHDSAEFWDSVIEAPATTNNKYYTDAIFEKAKNLLAASQLFDEIMLTLKKSTLDTIESDIDKLVDEFGGGNEEAFAAVLSEYGFTVDDIREYKQLCAKAEAAANELYGEDGWKISAGLKDEYLKENYVAFRQIYLANSYNLFELDANGDVIYYDGKGNVAYDTVNGKAEMGEGGKIVYYTEDGRIAYDKKSGKPSPVIDESGYQKMEDYTHEELLERFDLAAELMEIGAESAERFEALANLYSDDGLAAKTSIYVAKNVSYESLDTSYAFLDGVRDMLLDMKVGEVSLFRDESGLHIIRKYVLEDGAYANKELAGWFKDSTFGVYDFTSNLKNDLFNKALAEYHGKITVNTDALASVSLKTAKPNYYYK